MSRDCGQTWTRLEDIGNVSVLSAAFSAEEPATLILGTDVGIFLSDDAGRTFRPSNRGLVHRRILAAAANGSKGFVIGSDGGGIYTSQPSGHTWRQTYRGLNRSGIGALFFDDSNTLYVGAEGLLCRTEDLGSSFQQLYHLLSPIRAISVFKSSTIQRSPEPVVSWNQNNTYLIGTEKGEIHRSDDFGESWECVLKGAWSSIRKIECWAGSPNVVHAVAQTRALYKSEDSGRTWSKVAVSNYQPTTFAAIPGDRSRILTGTFENGVLSSEGDGASWCPVGVGLPKKPVICLAVSATVEGTRLFAGLQNGGFWQCDRDWSQWVQISGIAEGESINDMVLRDRQIFLATNTGVLISRDGGANWANWSEGMSNIRQVTRIVRGADGQQMFCGEVAGLYGRRFAS
jgi:photosystem II stability/assembly factor-like uncharacterized protein